MHTLSITLGGMSAASAIASAFCWIKAARVTMPTLTFRLDGARPHEVKAEKVQGFWNGWAAWLAGGAAALQAATLLCSLISN